MRVSAPAKINLFLHVGARREDGLHEITSVMQAVSLHDVVSLTSAEDLSVAVSPAGAAPADDTNLAARAARQIAALKGVAPAVRISIEKRIPTAAGLGGGSADAAATLVGLNDLWSPWSSRKAMEKMAAPLGSDVPFCVRGGTVLVSAAGEDLSSLPCARPLWWVIGIASFGLATADVYAEFDRLALPMPASADDPFAVVDAIARGDVDLLAPALRNDLEPAVLSLQPRVSEGRAVLRDAGALAVILSGSGPTWLGLARDESHAREVAAHLARDESHARAAVFARVEVAHSLDHGPRIA